MPEDKIVNCMTIDLEDWLYGAVSTSHPITTRVIHNVERLLRLLERYRVRATFFALGKVCEKFPILLNMITAAGHEIGSHGYAHEPVFMLTPEAFRDDVRRSIDVIVGQTGTAPQGYRAPGFSIDQRCLWAGPILAECGFAYSSSIFPIRGKRYGMPDAPRWPHRWHGCDLLEFPLTTVKLLGRNLPMCGGGYFRLLPWPILSLALSRVNRQGHPAVIYMHPYELDDHEAVDLRKQGHVISTKTRFMQSLFRSRVRARLERLFQQYRFAPMAEVLEIVNPADTPRA